MMANMVNGVVNQPSGLDRVGAIAIEDRQPGKAREIRGDILARCLKFRGNRNAVAIILNINEQRQLLSGGNG